MKMKKLQLLNLLLAFLTATSLSAQGFQQLYDFNGPVSPNNTITAVTPTPDGGYLFFVRLFGSSHRLVKTDPLGEIIWSRNIQAVISDDPVADLFVQPNGDYMLGLYIETTQATSLVMHFDGMGNLLHQRGFPGFIRIHTKDDGLFVANRQNDSTIQVYRLDPTLATVWNKPLKTTKLLFMPDMITTSDGGLCILGSYDSLPGNPNSPKLIKADANGNKQWEQKYLGSAFTYFGALSQAASGGYFLNTTDGTSTDVIRTDNAGGVIWSKNLLSSFFTNCTTPDGGVALAGTDFDVFGARLTKLDAAGTLLFERDFLPNENDAEAFHIQPTPDNGLILSGHADSPYYLGLLIKTDANGNLYSNFIQGYAHFDQNHNCAANTNEPALANWIATATKNGQTFTTRTRTDGFYDFNVPPGDYAVQIHPPGPLWEPCNGGLYNVSITGSPDTAFQDFPVQDSALCSLLDVSISAPFLRRCFDAVYQVFWCNRGTFGADDAVIQVVLPPQLNFISATLAPSAQSGDTLWFALGTVGFAECGDFKIRVNVDCNTTQLGQTLCTTARIFPDTLCVQPPSWSGARVVADAQCVGDTMVEFSLKNTGTAPTQMLDYIITEDHVVLYNGTFNLAPGQQMFIQRPANGSTQRIEAGQEPEYPFPSHPSAAIEGCGGWASTGVINQYALDDADPFTDIDCQEVRGSYDPNDKQGFPAGYGAEHWIEPETELTYLIRFQNTGTDTAFYVEVRDTLSPWLDPATLRTGAASHDYTWNLSGAGALSFRFDNILLPDSNVNEPASHGFVQFRIRPKNDAPLNTLIENEASIYFDFNAPVLTNTTGHRLGRDFYTVSLDELPGSTGLPVSIQPNPFRERTRLVLPDYATGLYRFCLYDAGGQMVWDRNFSGPVMELSAAALHQGTYWFELRGPDGKAIARGKMQRAGF